VSGADAAELAAPFAEQRERLVGMAYRMLGSSSDAEDAVQEAWLRLARQDAGAIENLPGWLTSVVARLCLDVLRSRKVRPEAPYDELSSEPVATEEDREAPEAAALLVEDVGAAMLVVLDRLRPAERVAFVLHDVFAIPFRDVAAVIDKSTDATRMLASRARRKVRCTRPPVGGPGPRREVVDAFRTAARGGDLDELIRVLAPEGHCTPVLADTRVRLGRRGEISGAGAAPRACPAGPRAGRSRSAAPTTGAPQSPRQRRRS